MTYPMSDRRLKVVMAAAAMAFASACASTPKATVPAKTEVLTVQQLQNMLRVDQGLSFTDIMGEIQQSGTVYRLTDDQSQHLRGSAFSATLLSFIELTYTHAIEANPALKNSNDQWHQIDGYWYGGRPFGWPEAWVVGAPRVGERWRKQ